MFREVSNNISLWAALGYLIDLSRYLRVCSVDFSETVLLYPQRIYLARSYSFAMFSQQR